MEPVKTYAISRIELPGIGTIGWQVRLSRVGRRYSKFFSDRVHGGTQLAFEVAVQYRDELIARLPDPERAGAAGKMTRRNVSGVVGVSRIIVRTRKAQYEFWQATWSPEPGVRKRVKYSIRRYGQEKAFELACIARREGEKDML